MEPRNIRRRGSQSSTDDEVPFIDEEDSAQEDGLKEKPESTERRERSNVSLINRDPEIPL
jgi:hypothetical protein